MANMTFKADLLPNADLQYSLGSESNPQKRWKIYGDCVGYLPLSGGSMTGTIDRAYTASNQTPMLHMDGVDYDNYLWQIGFGNTSNQYYGYGLKYIGTGAGVNNYLRLIANNQNGTDVTAICINQNGQVGIKRDATTDYSLTVNGSIAATTGGVIWIDHTDQGAKTAGTAYNAIGIKFKNSANDTIYTGYPIRYLGTNGTDGYNTGIILGSQNGSTFLGAGESSNVMPGVLTAYNNENLYLTTDGSMGFYTNCTNDGSSYVTAMTISTAGVVSVPNGNLQVGVNGDTTAERSIRCQSGAGMLYLYSVASTTGNRGLYVPAHGTGAAKSVIVIDTNNNATFNGNATSASSADKWTTARTLKVGNTGKSVDGSANVSWSHAEIGATVSNTWTGGVGAGPTIKTTVNSIAGTAVAIPTATASASGAVIAGTQTFGGVKHFNSNITIGPRTGWNTAAAGITIHADGTMHLGHASSGGSVNFHWAAASAATAYISECVNGTIRANSRLVVNGATHWQTLGGGTTTTAFAFAVLGNGFIRDTVYTNAAYSVRANRTAATGTGTIINWYNRGQWGGDIIYTNGTTTTAGYVQMRLGNNVAEGTDKNAYGYLSIYTRSTGAAAQWAERKALGGTTRDCMRFSYVQGTQIWGAVWNDYAEFRKTKEEIEPGRCVIETGKGDMILSTERLQNGAEIISDTFGFAIGQNEHNNTPIAVSGRVLAYLYEDKEYAWNYIGWPVCSGPNGTVSIMTEEEASKYPWKIIGTISEIPDYDKWQIGEKEENTFIDVNGRIWIRI